MSAARRRWRVLFGPASMTLDPHRTLTLEGDDLDMLLDAGARRGFISAHRIEIRSRRGWEIVTQTPAAARA